MHQVPVKPKTLRTRILDVIRPGEYLSLKRIVSRLKGHPDTWSIPDRSNVRRVVHDMERRGELVAQFNRPRHRTEYGLAVQDSQAFSTRPEREEDAVSGTVVDSSQGATA